MRKSKREGYTQSYNCQAAVDADGSQWIVGQRVIDHPSDAGQLEPGLQSIPPTLGQPTGALADCGYADKEVFQRLVQERPGLELHMSVHREDAPAERRYDYRPPDKMGAPKKIVDPVLVAMAEKLKTTEGKAKYRKRASTVEPVFGIIKAALGLRQFLLRGLEKVRGEWNLVCVAYNLKRLHRLVANRSETVRAETPERGSKKRPTGPRTAVAPPNSGQRRHAVRRSKTRPPSHPDAGQHRLAPSPTDPSRQTRVLRAPSVGLHSRRHRTTNSFHP